MHQYKAKVIKPSDDDYAATLKRFTAGHKMMLWIQLASAKPEAREPLMTRYMLKGGDGEILVFSVENKTLGITTDAEQQAVELPLEDFMLKMSDEERQEFRDRTLVCLQETKWMTLHQAKMLLIG